MSASSLSRAGFIFTRQPPLFAGASRSPGDACALDAREIASRDCAPRDRTSCWTPVRSLSATKPRLDDRAAPRGRTRRGGKIRGSLTSGFGPVNRARSRARFINRGDETEGRETRARTSVDAARHGACRWSGSRRAFRSRIRQFCVALAPTPRRVPSQPRFFPLLPRFRAHRDHLPSTRRR